MKLNPNKIFFVIMIFLAGLGLVACGKSGNAITVAGSTAFQPFAEKLADQFMAGTPGASVTIQGGGSAVGIQATLSGAADIGMADMVTLPKEALTLKTVIVARDGIVMVVNPKNTVKTLTVDQIRDIYNGKIRNWKDAGGKDHAVTVISREEGSGTRSSFETIIKNVTLTKEAIIQDSNGTVRETVANDINSIGYISHGLVNDKISALLINGVACVNEEINKGRYPLVRPVFLMTREAPQGLSKSFIDYILSEQGQKTILANGLLPAK